MNLRLLVVLLAASLLAGCVNNRPNHLTETGTASWYGGSLDGGPTASGERFHKDRLTAAHRTLPFNTIVRVENMTNGLTVDVRINDRGPWGHAGRILDLSEAAAHVLAVGGAGIIPIKMEVLQLGDGVVIKQGSPTPYHHHHHHHKT
jgi:rare lipoprotein A